MCDHRRSALSAEWYLFAVMLAQSSLQLDSVTWSKLRALSRRERNALTPADRESYTQAIIDLHYGVLSVFQTMPQPLWLILRYFKPCRRHSG